MMLWNPVPGFLDYEVSEYGDLRRGPKHLKPERVQGSGRKRFTLSKGGCIYRLHAAHLVALAFIGSKPFDGAQVCHNDSFEHNNHYSNLRWDTRKGNAADARARAIKLREGRGATVSRQKRLAAEASRFLSEN